MGKAGNKGGGVSPGMLDKLLVPRIENYALNNDINDIDEVADFLRKTYKEYQRKQLGPFKGLVSKAVHVVQRRGGPAKPELQLQALEDRHLSGRRKGADGGDEEEEEQDGSASSSGSGGSSSDGDDSGSSEPELDEEQAKQMAAASMNAKLLSMYNKQGSAGAAAAAAAAAGGSSSHQQQQQLQQQQQQERGLLPRPAAAGAGAGATAAFAPQHVIAAAATRALEAKAHRLGAPTPGARTPAAAAADNDDGTAPSTSGAGVIKTPTAALGAAAPAATAAAALETAAPTPATAGATTAGGKDKRSRKAADAGIKKDRSTVKKARTGAGSAGGGGGGGFAGGGRRGGSSVSAAKAVTYADLGGIEDVLKDIRELVEYPLKHPEVYAWLGVEPPRGVLLHGPPGCGKTALANAIANECGVPFLRVSAPEVVSGMSGESEAKLRGIFQEAADLAPCIVFIDEIDAIAPKRETAQREMERRIVAQMLTCMDDLAAPMGDDAAAAAAADADGDDAGERAGGAGGVGGRKLLEDLPEGDGTAGAATAAAAGREEGGALGDGGGGFPPPRVPPARPHVVVIGATNRPDALDPALRRAGRFDREISLGIPTEAARAKILQVITKRLRLEGNFDFKAVAKKTPGFVGADLAALTKEAAAVAVTRIFTQLEAAQQRDADSAAAAAAAALAAARALAAGAGGGSGSGSSAAALDAFDAAALPPPAAALVQQRFGGGPLTASELGGLAITMSDFLAALPKVQPSVRREGFTTTPDVTWDDVGALDEVREELSFSISQPIAHPERFEAMGLAAATGVLLYGPPGCGKTLVAKAVANESGANFISIKGPELLNKYVGESERAVRQLFGRARAAHPCVLFFDELDALAPRRGNDTNQAAERVVNQLLTEMDGIDGRQGVYIIAATNRPDMIDPALLRPGRLDKVLYVPLPPPDGRVSILRALTRKAPLAGDVDVAAIGNDGACNGFSGADLAALVREACVIALKESMGDWRKQPTATAATAASAAATTASAAAASTASTAVAGEASAHVSPQVFYRHFVAAFQKITPSVSKKDQKQYDALRGRLRASRGTLSAAPGVGDAPAAGGGPPPAGAPAAADPARGHIGGGGDGDDENRRSDAGAADADGGMALA